ncbi:MAG: hypothetical protein U1E65_02485 [Myxococcota bacterium]
MRLSLHRAAVTPLPSTPKPAKVQLGPAKLTLPPPPSGSTSIGPLRAIGLALGLEGGLSARVPLHDTRLLAEIKRARPRLAALSTPELRARFTALVHRARQGTPVTALTAEALGIAREMSRRVLQKEPYEVQLLAAVALSEGKLAQLKTGEGKTLAAGLAAIVLALSGKGAHVATSNGYLAERDAEDLRPLFEALGLSVGVAKSWGQTYEEKRQAYGADVTYAHADTLAFDWIEDQTWWQRDWRVQRPLHAVIVDEADEVLLDTATHPLVLCGSPEPSERFQARAALLRSANEIAAHLDREGLIEIDHEAGKRRPYLTEAGTLELERLVREQRRLEKPEAVWTEEHGPLLLSILQALEARHAVVLGKDYIQDGEGLTLVASGTGRPNPGARLRHGLMDSVLAKEDKAPEPELLPLGAISYPAFFARYQRLAGMTGTTHGRQGELLQLYQLGTVEIPTHRPSRRVDEPDAFFPHPAQRLLAAVADVIDAHERGQPVLVSTVSVAASKEVSARLCDPLRCLVDVALSSGPLFEEACALLTKGKQILAQGAGSEAARRAVGAELLIAMRAEPEALARFAEILEEAGLPASRLLAHPAVPHRLLNAETHAEEAAIIGEAGKKGAITVATQMAGRGTDIPLSEEVKALDGLRVIGIERKANLRQDEQVRGRAGRQGQPGSSRFYVSLSDEVFTYLPAKDLRVLAERVATDRLDELSPSARAAYQQALRKAQERGEEEKAAVRRQGMRLSSALESARQELLGWRDEVLDDQELGADLAGWLREEARAKSPAELGAMLLKLDPAAVPPGDRGALLAALEAAIAQRLTAVPGERGEEPAAFNQFLRGLVLSRLDQAWLGHVMSEEDRQRDLYLLSFGEGDPFVKHQLNSAQAFRATVEHTKAEIRAAFFSVLRPAKPAAPAPTAS